MTTPASAIDPGPPHGHRYATTAAHGPADWTSDGKRPQKITRKTLPEVILEGERGTVEFHIDQGVFVPMARAEIRKIRAAQEGDDYDDE